MRHHGQNPGVDNSTARHTLRAFNITSEEIARHSGVSPALVDAALHPEQMAICPIITLIQVQRTVETCLRERGWRGDPGTLWQEYHALVQRTAVTIAERRRNTPLAGVYW